MAEIITVEFASPATPAGRTAVRKLEGREALGQLFEFDVTLETADLELLDEATILSSASEIRFLRGGRIERTIYGVATSIRAALSPLGHHATYRIRFVPRLAVLARHVDSEIFLDKTIPEIVEAKLTQAGFQRGDDFELRLLSSYPTRDFVVQYRESDLGFVMRLCEHWGITLFFEHHADRDVAVFADDNSRFGVLSAPMRYEPRGEASALYKVESVTETLPASYAVDDYNYRTPSVTLRTGAAVAAGSAGLIVESGVHCKTPEEAELLARLRAEETACRRRVLEGESDLTLLSPGQRGKIEDHPLVSGEWLLTRVEHAVEQPVFGRGRGDERRYCNAIWAIDARTPYRAARLTPKPRVHGAINAVIEAEQPGAYAELDGDGRYHVRFMFDAGAAPKGKASKPIRMAQPHVGAGFGMHFPLRDGVEVLVTFIDGDPDRPVISGAVPNPTTPSVVGSGNAVRNVIRTGGGTEINIDDTDGLSRLKMTVPHSNTVLQLGSPNQPTDGVHIGTDEQMLIETGTTVEITAGSTMTLNANPTITANAPMIDLEGTGTVLAHAPEVTLVGDDTISATAPIIVVNGDGSVTITAPLVFVNGTALDMSAAPVNLMSSTGLTGVSSAAITCVSAPNVLITGGNVTISGDAAVTIKAGKIDLNP